uniref:C-type lectin domain-containing protein n=1 Tax=Haplochromis burtoni TaxID=8153 RepID=A0A3Q3CZ65_HAPBU
MFLSYLLRSQYFKDSHPQQPGSHEANHKIGLDLETICSTFYTHPFFPHFSVVLGAKNNVSRSIFLCCNLLKDKQSYKCEDGWKKHGRKCYYVSVSKTSWNESRDECRAKKGYLVKIDSTKEQKFLESKLKEIMNDDMFWIGLIYSAEDNTWVRSKITENCKCATKNRASVRRECSSSNNHQSEQNFPE